MKLSRSVLHSSTSHGELDWLVQLSCYEDLTYCQSPENDHHKALQYFNDQNNIIPHLFPQWRRYYLLWLCEAPAQPEGDRYIPNSHLNARSPARHPAPRCRPSRVSRRGSSLSFDRTPSVCPRSSCRQRWWRRRVGWRNSLGRRTWSRAGGWSGHTLFTHSFWLCNLQKVGQLLMFLTILGSKFQQNVRNNNSRQSCSLVWLIAVGIVTNAQWSSQSYFHPIQWFAL